MIFGGSYVVMGGAEAMALLKGTLSFQIIDLGPGAKTNCLEFNITTLTKKLSSHRLSYCSTLMKFFLIFLFMV